MIYRACVRFLYSTTRSDAALLRASIHTTIGHGVKKNTETTTTSSTPPVKDKTSSKDQSGTYTSGEEFFSHNPYTFYDAEIDMAKDRIQQPSSKPDTKPLGS